MDEDNCVAPEDLEQYCCGLVVTLDDPIEGSGVIKLVHYTAYEFLDRFRDPCLPEAPYTITRSCLTYLSYDHLSSGICKSKSDFLTRLQQYPLLPYAASCFGDLARKDRALLALLSPDFVSYLKDTKKVMAAWQIWTLSTRCHNAADLQLRKHYVSQNPLHPDGGQWTGLHTAAWLGSARLLQELIDVGLDVNALDEGGWTPLKHSVVHGNQSVALALLRQPSIDAEVRSSNYRCSYDQSDGLPMKADILFTAAMNNLSSVVRCLLDRHPLDVNVKNTNGESVLYIATAHRAELVVHELLQQETLDVNSLGRDGQSALYVACGFFNSEIAQLLLEYPRVDVNCQDKKGWSPLHVAAMCGHLSTVQKLLQHSDIDVNAAQSGETPLYSAIAGPSIPIAKLLLTRNDVDYNWVSPSTCQTALWVAVERQRNEVVAILLSKSDICTDTTGPNGDSFLHLAAIRGNLEALRLLNMHRSIDINHRDRNGRTALSYAAQGGIVPAFSFLLEQPDVDINIRDMKGRTALYLAATNGHVSIVQLLLEQPSIERDAKEFEAQFADLNVSKVPTRRKLRLSWVSKSRHLHLYHPRLEMNSRRLHRCRIRLT